MVSGDWTIFNENYTERDSRIRFGIGKISYLIHFLIAAKQQQL
jgi:hypothetical protein